MSLRDDKRSKVTADDDDSFFDDIFERFSKKEIKASFQELSTKVDSLEREKTGLVKDLKASETKAKELSDKLAKADVENKELYKKLSDSEKARKAAESALEAAKAELAKKVVTPPATTAPVAAKANGEEVEVSFLSKSDREIYEGILAKISEMSDEKERLLKNIRRKKHAISVAKSL